MNVRYTGVKFISLFLVILSLIITGFGVISPCIAFAEGTGWVKINGLWYYCDEEGTRLTGWIKDGNKWYYLNEEGVMTTGWQKVGRKWYYMNRYGVMQRGWIRLSGKWYYLNAAGAMSTGFKTIDNSTYYFDKSGVMKTGWKKIGGSWYYFNKSGVMQSNTIVDGWILGRSGTASEIAVGNTIRFGGYEQDNNFENGVEDIEWLVLEQRENKILIISTYALDRVPYNEDWEEVTWETCELRAWLKNDFLNAAFNSKELSRIISTAVTADKNPDYGTNAGNSTTDPIFLLSVAEADKYFSSDEARQCAPTAYSAAQGVYADAETLTLEGVPAAWWWLRTPGDDRYGACYVSNSGAIDTLGFYAYVEYAGVRPAMWIEIGA